MVNSIVNVCSPTFEWAESYGRLAEELSRGLAEKGIHVNKIGGQVEDGAHFLPAMGGFLLGYPTLYELFTPLANLGPRVALTMFESTGLPEGWAERLNKVSTITVPARWLVQVFRDNGITTPVEVVPLGISETFKKPQRRYAENSPFTFITFADRGWRKGWWHALRAFVGAFGHDMNYRLIIKVRNAPALSPIQNPNVQVITDDYTDEQMVELYHQCHVMIAANCAEGFGFLPREFAATGGLALATNWGGTADDIEHWGIPVPYAIDKAWPDDPEWWGKMGRWAEPDVDALAYQLRYVAENYSAYQDFAVRAAGFVAANYRWSLYTKQMWSVWEQTVEAYHASNYAGTQEIPA
jgi:glycosyltransferase involved in cell wall biosynthesis